MKQKPVENAHVAKESMEETHDGVNPIGEEVPRSHSHEQQWNAAASASPLSSEDEAYVKRLFARPDVHKYLVTYRHYPFRVNELLIILQKYDSRAFDVLLFMLGYGIDYS